MIGLTGGTPLQIKERGESPPPWVNREGVLEWPAADRPSLLLSCPALDSVPDDTVDKPGEFPEKPRLPQRYRLRVSVARQWWQ